MGGESKVDGNRNGYVIVTAALPYANGEIHLGHVTSTYLPADIFSRYLKLKGRKVLYVSGTDDHGTPILIQAEKEGIPPEELVRKWLSRDIEDFSKLGIEFSIFYKTHSPENIELTQRFFENIYKKGFIFKQEIEQWYCGNCKRFLPDRYVVGTCPFCGAENQYSDGCEVCGRAFPSYMIKEPKCIVCGSTPFLKESIHYFFKLSSFSDQLRGWLVSNSNLQPEVRNYVLKWIEDGLKDWDITRDISWGVPIPLNEKDAEGKVLYGWFDNHLGYIAFTYKYFRDHMGEEVDTRKIWNSSVIYHFIGKDIVYHHYLFLPAMRMAEGSFKLPDYLPTRGHLLLQNEKFSKSKGWYISLRNFLEIFPPDYLRFYLALTTPYSQKDVNFDWDDFQLKLNNELIANIGNFIHRVLTFTYSYFEGIVPEPSEMEELDLKFVDDLKQAVRDVGELMDEIKLDKALKRILDFSTSCNRYFQSSEPWGKRDKGKTCIYLSINAVRTLSILLWPFIPFTIEKLWNTLNIPKSFRNSSLISWSSVSELKIKPGHKINKPSVLFKRMDKEIMEQKEKFKKKH